MMPFQRVMIRIAALAALSLGALTACTVVVDDPGQRPRPRPEPSTPQMCTMQYDPVCAQRGGDRRTFSNACQARADGYRITGRGECRPERPDFGNGRPQVCTREYAPVCATQGRRQQTFANGCMAQAEGFRVIGRGECRRPDRPIDDSGMRPPPRDPDRRPQACTREFAPVCARQGRQQQTFPNACTAQAQGFRVIDNNACR
ncbi:membrane protein [Pararhizobium polonicum]|uniref:Membrane protein n=1 Tax=Pararhizobium polonicum TaxID=1612624 RepID=A0A1C7NXS9_9HYPH|nr:Kazal-type serine protease inhibitor domain-containing protein [Pararhizobium polonicum]OBZ93795.1 membrane protein [Pararhizobium polonicum]